MKSSLVGGKKKKWQIIINSIFAIRPFPNILHLVTHEMIMTSLGWSRSSGPGANTDACGDKVTELPIQGPT